MLHHLQRCPRSVQIQFSWLRPPRTTGGRNDRYCRLRVTLSRWYTRAKRASAGDLSAHRGGAGAIRSDIGPTPMSLATVQNRNARLLKIAGIARNHREAMMKRRRDDDEIRLRISMPHLASVGDQEPPFEHHVFTYRENALLEHGPYFV